MQFSEDRNKITIVAEDHDEKHIEVEDLRRQKARSDELERKLAAVMEQLGITEI